MVKSGLRMKIFRVRYRLLQIRPLATNTMLTKSAMESVNRFMFETLEKSSVQKTSMLTVLAKTAKTIKKAH